jgi:hypothetical protein
MPDDQEVQPSDAQPTSDQLPVGDGQNGTAPVPQPPAPQQPVAAQPPTPDQQNTQIQQAKDSRDKQLDFHPAVTAAHVARKVGEAIAGGPRIKTTIDPNTGTVTREKVPLSTKEILTGAIANILGGISQVGQAGVAAAQHRPAPPPQPLPTQVAAQQQAQQTQADFEQQQQTKVQQAKVLNANLEAMRTAYAIGKEDDDSKDSLIQNHADDLANWQKSGAVSAANVPSNELMQRNFSPSKYVAVPDGKVPVFNPDGKRATDSNGVPLSQLTYSVVDGTTQTPLTQDKYAQLAKYGLMQAKEGFKLPEGATISSASLALMNHKLDLINQTQREIDEVAGDGKVDLAAQIKKNPQFLSAIEKFHNDAANTEPDQQLATMEKVHPQAAGMMRELFGNDNLQKYAEARTARIAGEKTGAEATARANAGAGTPLGQAALQEKQLQVQKIQKEIADKGGIDFSKINTTPIDGVSFQPDPTYRVNADVLTGIQQQDPGLAASVKAIGEGRELMTPQAQRTKDGQAIMKAVNLAYPDYNAAKVDSYFKGRQTGTSGTLGNKVNSFATAMDHLQRYYDNIAAVSTIPGVNTIASALGNEKAKGFETDRHALATEIASAYKGGGVPSEKEIEKWTDALGGITPAQARNGAVETAKLLHGKFSEYSNQYRNMIPGGLKDDNFQLMSDQAAKAYQHVTGQPIGNTQPLTQGQQQPQGGSPKPPDKQAILQSITLPGGGHPADVKWMPDGTQIFHSGKPTDPWTTISGSPVR